MKNADMPASPSVIENVEFDLCCEVDEAGLGAIKREGERRFEVQYHGLTKREHFAGLAMKGCCADEASWDQTAAEVARCSVAMADALLAELERTK